MDKFNFLVISLVEAIYVVYMMNYFKTRYSLAHPFTYFENKFLYHPIGEADKPICNICPMGNKGSVLIAIFLILRWIIFSNTSNKGYLKGLKMFNMLVLSITFLLSLLNFNAVVYLLPYFILEIYIIKNIL